MSKIKENYNTIEKIKETILKQIEEGKDYPYLYSVITFGFYDNYGIKLPYSETRKYWDKGEVSKTTRLIRNMLKETFDMNAIYFFIERHSPLLDENGETIREGRFHLNIISSSISDSLIEEPNRKVRRLMMEGGKLDIPINQNVYNDLDEIKIELFDACCKRANWVNRYKYSIKTQMLYEPTDVESAVLYCLKDYNTKSNIDFMDIVDFKNSDFYKP